MSRRLGYFGHQGRPANREVNGSVDIRSRHTWLLANSRRFNGRNGNTTKTVSILFMRILLQRTSRHHAMYSKPSVIFTMLFGLLRLPWPKATAFLRKRSCPPVFWTSTRPTSTDNASLHEHSGITSTAAGRLHRSSRTSPLASP